MSTVSQALTEKKMDAEIAKLMAETAKINKETKWYEFVVITALVVAVITITKLFL